MALFLFLLLFVVKLLGNLHVVTHHFVSEIYQNIRAGDAKLKRDRAGVCLPANKII